MERRPRSQRLPISCGAGDKERVAAPLLLLERFSTHLRSPTAAAIWQTHYWFWLHTFRHRSSLALSASGPTTTPLLVKSISLSTAGSWRGHCGRLAPFGSPVLANET